MTKTSFKLYNTYTRQLEQFEPLTDLVKIYTCGPTVYNDQHIGNYRTYIFEDILVRTLLRFGYQVKRVMNITDVGHLTSDQDTGEDKLEVGAKREGKTAWEVANLYLEHFLADCNELKFLPPDRVVRATETIQAQINLIKVLEQKGYTYLTSDGVYFDSSKLESYGELARLDLEGMRAGERVELGEKRGNHDFALWKFSPSGVKRDMEWDSPWGSGFPGWHIECSAIMRQELGEQIDIHCGGVDHIPVHHTNEIAQSEAAFGVVPAKYWLHGEFLQVEGGKMAKSLGNVYTLKDLAERGVDPLSLRVLCYTAGYRTKLNFTFTGLFAAHKSLLGLRQTYQASLLASTGKMVEEADSKPFLDRFTQALAEDLNLAEAMAVVYEVAKLANPDLKRTLLDSFDQVLQLDLAKPPKSVEDEIPEAVSALVKKRELARFQKDWAESDSIREQIKALGFGVEDGVGEGALTRVFKLEE